MGAGYKDLVVWQKAIGLVKDIYKSTQSFPKEELYGLTNQIRRCAVSIPANLSEGYGRSGTQEYIQFVSIALGSATELETLLLIANQLSMLDDGHYKRLSTELESILRMLQKLRQSLRAKANRK